MVGVLRFFLHVLPTTLTPQVTHFGATPAQLFRRPHPQRGRPPPPSADPLWNAPDALTLTGSSRPALLGGDTAATSIVAVFSPNPRTLVAVSASGRVAAFRLLSPRDAGAFTFGGAPAGIDGGWALERAPGPAAPLPCPARGGAAAPSASAYAVVAGGGGGGGATAIAAARAWDASLRFFAAGDGRCLLAARGVHGDVVTCVASTSDGRALVAGSADTAASVWRCGGDGGALPSLTAVLTGAPAAVTAVAACADLALAAVASADGRIALHSLAGGACVRAAAAPGGGAVGLLSFAPPAAALVAYTPATSILSLLDVTTLELRACVDAGDALTDVKATRCSRFVVCAGARSGVTIRSLPTFALAARVEAPAASVAPAGPECIVVGTTDGRVLLLTVDARKRVARRAVVVGSV